MRLAAGIRGAAGPAKPSADARQSERLKAIEPDGYDLVVDATGVPSVIEQTFGYARARGKIWVFGVAPRESVARFVPFDVFRKDLKIIGSFAVNRTFPQSIALIQGGSIQVEPLISHQLPLSDFCLGLELAQNDPKRVKFGLRLRRDGVANVLRRDEVYTLFDAGGADGACDPGAGDPADGPGAGRRIRPARRRDRLSGQR
jgi:threonine dehydrogenase-like Zn-dependent dehydrogenase